VQTTRILDTDLLKAMLAHRSMRIDGPSFRGRPLGHKFDPLRSQIAPCSPDLFGRLTQSLLDSHSLLEYRRTEVEPDLQVVAGRLYQTIEWQSPAFAEYGFGPGQDLRDEPPIEVIHGDLLAVIDQRPERSALSSDERSAVIAAVDGRAPGTAVALLFNGPELSGTGGLWRSCLRESAAPDPHVLGLESLTSLVLVATLVYLEFAPELAWHHINYQM